VRKWEEEYKVGDREGVTKEDVGCNITGCPQMVLTKQQSHRDVIVQLILG